MRTLKRYMCRLTCSGTGLSRNATAQQVVKDIPQAMWGKLQDLNMDVGSTFQRHYRQQPLQFNTIHEGSLKVFTEIVNRSPTCNTKILAHKISVKHF